MEQCMFQMAAWILHQSANGYTNEPLKMPFEHQWNSCMFQMAAGNSASVSYRLYQWTFENAIWASMEQLYVPNGSWNAASVSYRLYQWTCEDAIRASMEQCMFQMAAGTLHQSATGCTNEPVKMPFEHQWNSVCFRWQLECCFSQLPVIPMNLWRCHLSITGTVYVQIGRGNTASVSIPCASQHSNSYYRAFAALT